MSTGDPVLFLWDARDAAALILEFDDGSTLERWRADAKTRAAVEREFTIIAEALGRVRRLAPELAARVHDLPRIIGFRNHLVHGYDVLDDQVVWEIVKDDVPRFLAGLDILLAEFGPRSR